MNILFLAHRIPYPPNKGDKIRAFHEISYLNKNHNVDLCTLIDDKNDFQYVETLRKHCRNLEYCVINSKLKKIFSLFSVLTCNKTCTEKYFWSPSLFLKCKKLILKNKYDIIFIYCSSMAKYVQHYSDKIPCVIDFVDIDSNKWLQYSKFAKFPLNFLYSLESKKLAVLEKTILSWVKASFLVTEREVIFFAGLNSKNNIYAIPNGIDNKFFDPSKTSDLSNLQTQPYICFTGAMDYFPNEDGVVFFAEKIFPRISEKYPKLKFFIVGRNPAAAVEKLTVNPNIIVTGSVDDIRPYLKQAKLAVIPLRMARGIQNKILESVSMGLPVVTTSIAYEGLNLKKGLDIIVEDDPLKFADQVISLLQDKNKRKQISLNAKQCLMKSYGWNANLKKMEEILLKSAKK
ncbi:TIGR03087 family PEP-CTERM/XrtA system glycosyltransferase [bacterium]|nr:TIGR03087 family PEP-CTERM/XrtA system glycosyltransferase [bacterium]